MAMVLVFDVRTTIAAVVLEMPATVRCMLAAIPLNAVKSQILVILCINFI